MPGLQHGLAASELDQLARLKRFDLRDDLVIRVRLAASKRVLGIAPRAAQVAPCKPYKDAGHAGKRAFALNGPVQLDEPQRANRRRRTSLTRDVEFLHGL